MITYNNIKLKLTEIQTVDTWSQIVLYILC